LWEVFATTSVFVFPHTVQVYVFTPSLLQLAAIVTLPLFQVHVVCVAVWLPVPGVVLSFVEVEEPPVVLSLAEADELPAVLSFVEAEELPAVLSFVEVEELAAVLSFVEVEEPAAVLSFVEDGWLPADEVVLSFVLPAALLSFVSAVSVSFVSSVSDSSVSICVSPVSF